MRVKGIWAWLGAYVFSQIGIYFAGKAAVEGLGVFTFLPVYLLGSGLVLLAISRGRAALGREAAALGLMQALSSGLWIGGLLLLQPATSAAINYFMPFVAAAIAAGLLGERLEGREAYGIAVAAAGVILLTLGALRGPSSRLGVALTVANVFAWASYSLYYRKLSSFDPVQLNAASLIIGGAASLPLLALASLSAPAHGLSLSAVEAMAATVLSASLGFVSWNLIMRSRSAARATMMSYAVPAAIAALQAAVGEPPPAPETLGIGLMVLGAAVAYSG